MKINGGVITLYDPAKWQILDQHFTAFTEQGKVFSRQLSDRILRKGILSCVFQHIKTNRKLLLVNVHLTANYGQKSLVLP